MPLAEDNDMIKTFPSDRADQPIRMSILPWRVRHGRSITNPHRIKTSFEYLAIDAVAIANKILSQPQAIEARYPDRDPR